MLVDVGLAWHGRHAPRRVWISAREEIIENGSLQLETCHLPELESPTAARTHMVRGLAPAGVGEHEKCWSLGEEILPLRLVLAVDVVQEHLYARS